MNKLSIWHVLLALWISLGVFLWQKYLCDCWSGKSKTNQAITKTGTGPWNIADESDFSTTANEHFRFLTSSDNYLDPLSESLQKSANSTAEYLKANPKKSLTITGFYTSDEINHSVLPNLGLARANEIKSYLSNLGISAKQMSIDSKLLENKNWFVADTLQNGIDFSFTAVASNDDKLASIKKRLLGKPITLYFETNQKELTLSEAQRNDMADLIYYLDNVSSSHLDIGGHTDNNGKPNFNDFISKQRADFVANYLTINGNINSERLQAQGFGQNKPIVPNTTKGNKAINRRVEIILN